MRLSALSNKSVGLPTCRVFLAGVDYKATRARRRARTRCKRLTTSTSKQFPSSETEPHVSICLSGVARRRDGRVRRTDCSDADALGLDVKRKPAQEILAAHHAAQLATLHYRHLFGVPEFRRCKACVASVLGESSWS